MQHSSWVFYSGINFFLPPAPNYLVLCYSYPFLKLSSFSLADSTKIWLADRKCLGHTYMPCISQLGVTVLHSSPAVAAARKDDPSLWLCEARGREGSRSRSRDLAEPASGLTELLLSKVFYLYPLLVLWCKRVFLLEAIQHKPLALLSLQWLGDEYVKAKLHCYPLPQSKGWVTLCVVSLLHL